MLFHYPDKPHERRHGPQGYVDYQSYKPWLRDEFHFSCVYCLCRERWFPDGDDSFSVEHLEPQSAAPGRVCDYDNLLYACSRCNSLKQDSPPLLDPSLDALSEHLRVENDGTIHGLTPQGRALILVCRLDRPKLVDFRRNQIELFQLLRDLPRQEGMALLRYYFGFPRNLPDLSSLRPPQGNVRPQGVSSSYYELAKRGELPDVY